MIVLFPSKRSRSLRALHHLFCLLVLIVFRFHRNFFNAEVAVVRILVVVAAVRVHLLSLDRFSHINRVVAPLPDKAAAHLLLAVDQFKVIFKISRAVAHRMAVFAHDIRLIPVLHQLFFDLLE